MSNIKLTKMQGLGNDFIIVDYDQYEKTGMTMPDLAIKICNRNFGVGADGLIIPNVSPKDKSADIGWYFYNSDGTTAQMCGNGIRCFAKYVRDNKLVNSNKFGVETLAGIITPEIIEDGTVRVNMSKPILKPELIPFKIPNVALNSFDCFSRRAKRVVENVQCVQGRIIEQPCDAEINSARRTLNYPLQIEDRMFKINAVSMGNPHCIIFVEDDSDLLKLAKTYGPKIENYELFPEKTNVEFVKIISKNEIDLRVYERSCGITLACGTGACAAVVAGILNNLTEHKVKVNLLGGALTIEWQGSAQNLEQDVFMSGPAEYSFFAEYIL